MERLDRLEAELRAAIDGETLRLEAQLASALQLPEPPSWLGALVDLDLDAVSITRPAGLLVIAGGLEHPLLGRAAFSCEIAMRGDELEPKVRWLISQPPRLEDLLRQAGLGFAAAAGRFLDSTLAKAVRLQTLANGDPSVTLEVSGAYSARLAGLELSFAFSSIAFADRGTRIAQVRGSATFGDLVLPLSVTLDDPVRVSAILPNLSLMEVIASLGLPVPPIPPLPVLSTPLEALRFTFEPELRLSGRAPLGGVGALTFTVAEVGGEAVLVAALELAPGFTFGSLLPALAPFDQLQSILRIGTPAFVLATQDVKDFPYPTADGGWRPLTVEGAPAFSGELVLKGLGLDVVSALIGLEALPFEIPLSPSLDNLRLTAALPVRIEPIPGVLSVSAVQVDAVAQPFSLAASGQAELNLFGAQLPPLVLGAALGGTQQVLFLRTAEPWRQPLGLPIDIEELGLQVSTPPPGYGFFGTMRLASRELEVAAKFVGQAPTMLAAQAQGDLALSNLLAEIIGVDLLPDFFEPTVRDPSIYLVLNPLGEMIADRLYPAGVALSGAMEYLGLSADLRLSAKPDRVVAEAGLSGPVRFPPVLELTGPGGVNAPTFAIDTSGDPVVTLQARIMLMGLVQDISGVVGAGGVRIDLAQSVGPAHVTLRGRLGEGSFEAAGISSFGIKASIGPLRLYDGGPSLGEIRLDTSLDAETNIHADGSGARVAVRCAFTVLGLTVQLPEITVSPDSFARIPEQVVAYIKDHAEELFAELLGSADAWLRAIAQGLIVGVENVAAVLKEHFEQAATQIAKGLADTLNYTAEQTARALKSIGESAEEVARALSAVGHSPEDVAKALVGAAYPTKVVAEALGLLGIKGEEVGKLLAVAEIPLDVAERVIEEVFNIAPTLHVKGGLPFGKLPFVKVHGKFPFAKVHGKLPFAKVHGKFHGKFF